jgi:hypothetical protein
VVFAIPNDTFRESNGTAANYSDVKFSYFFSTTKMKKKFANGLTPFFYGTKTIVVCQQGDQIFIN